MLQVGRAPLSSLHSRSTLRRYFSGTNKKHHSESVKRGHDIVARQHLRKGSNIPSELHRFNKLERRKQREEDDVEAPDPASSRIINEIFHCRRDFKKAVQLLREFEKTNTPNTPVYTAVISVFAKAQKPIYANDFWVEMKQR